MFGTVMDIACLVLLVWLTRREGIRLFDLGNYRREGWLSDVLIGVGVFVPFIVLSAGLSVGTMMLLGYTPQTAEVEMPLWGILYVLVICPIIWAPTEDYTYGGYGLPRVEALTGKRWLTTVGVGFFWHLAAQFRALAASGLAAFRGVDCVLGSRYPVPILGILLRGPPLVARARCALFDRRSLRGDVASSYSLGEVVAVTPRRRLLERSGEPGAAPGRTEHEATCSRGSTLHRLHSQGTRCSGLASRGWAILNVGEP